MPRKKILSDKSQIIDVAQELIAAEGLEAVSMRRLSKEMGVSSKTLYNYVLNAEAVMREVLIRSFSGLYESVYSGMSEMISKGIEPSTAYARAYALTLFDFAESNREVCVYLIGMGYESYHNDAELRPLYDPFGAFLMSMDEGEDTDRLKKVFHLYEGSILSLIRNHTAKIKKLSREEFLEMVDLLLELMFE